MILNKYTIKFFIILLLVSFSIFSYPTIFSSKVKAAMCPSFGPVTSEWTTDNINYIRTVSLPNINGPIGVSNYDYDFWFKQGTYGGKQKIELSCDNVVFDFGGNTKYVKEITFQAHDRSDTGGFIIRIFKRNGTSGEEVWRKLDLDTVDGCSSGGDCYKTYTVQINATVNSIIFSGVHDESEKVYLRFLGLKGYGCPSNQTYSCSSDGTKATFSWQPISGAISYNLRIDRNVPSWFGSEDTADIGTSTLRTFPVTPNVKNSFSVQAIGFDEDYPYGGEMCWQEFTCKSILPPNNPPRCSNTPVTISPDTPYYLPDQQVNITAVGYSDLDSDPITITNWQPEMGTIISKSADSKNIIYKMPSTTNETFNISYVITDGKSNTTCSSQLKTKIAYKCENSTCEMDANGNFSTLTNCLENCNGAKKYSCSSGGACVYDPLNGTYSTSNCDNACNSEITCTNLNVVGDKNLPGSTITISAYVKNFPKAGDPATKYQWISDDLSLNKTGTLPNAIEYDTPAISYKVPNYPDTVYYKLNDNSFPACTLNVNETMPTKNINLKFNPTSKTIDDSVLNTDVNLITETTDFFSTYNLQLSCLDITDATSPKPCLATDIYKFTASNTTTLLLSNFSADKSSNLTLRFVGDRIIKLTAIGKTIPENASYTKTATATITVQKPKALSITVKEATDFREDKNAYCNNPYTPNFNKISFSLKDDNSFLFTRNLESSTPPIPPTLINGNYTISFNLNSGVLKKEIKCISINNDVKPTTSRSFTVNSNDVDIKVIVGPVWGNTWYQAFGGSAYSLGGFRSNIVTITSKILEDLTNVQSGVLNSTSLQVGEGKGPSKYVIYPEVTQLNSKDIVDLDKAITDSTITKITNLNSVSKDSDSVGFYYYKNNLVINNDFIVDSGKKIPVVFVKGNVTIKNTVKQVDMYLVSTGTISIGDNTTEEMLLTVNGAILSKSEVLFNSKKEVADVNGKLTEKFNYDPSVYFSESPNSYYFKTTNIYATLID